MHIAYYRGKINLISLLTINNVLYLNYLELYKYIYIFFASESNINYPFYPRISIPLRNIPDSIEVVCLLVN